MAGNPESGEARRPRCAGEDGGCGRQLLATDAHHEPDGDEGDENLQGDDGDLEAKVSLPKTKKTAAISVDRPGR